ncbi:MAG: hypothetical protein AAGK78_14370, partial [Planctomycetota bacterium]
MARSEAPAKAFGEGASAGGSATVFDARSKLEGPATVPWSASDDASAGSGLTAGGSETVIGDRQGDGFLAASDASSSRIRSLSATGIRSIEVISDASSSASSMVSSPNSPGPAGAGAATSTAGSANAASALAASGMGSTDVGAGWTTVISDGSCPCDRS